MPESLPRTNGSGGGGDGGGAAAVTLQEAGSRHRDCRGTNSPLRTNIRHRGRPDGSKEPLPARAATIGADLHRRAAPGGARPLGAIFRQAAINRASNHGNNNCDELRK